MFFVINVNLVIGLMIKFVCIREFIINEINYGSRVKQSLKIELRKIEIFESVEKESRIESKYNIRDFQIVFEVIDDSYIVLWEENFRYFINL